MSFNQALKRIIGRLPPKDWAQSKLVQHTPDVLELETQGFQRVFISDELMVGHTKHEELLNPYSACLCAGFTRDEFSHFLHKAKPYYPVALEEKVSPKPTRIKGELFAVLSSHMKLLDNYKLNGVEFRRKKIKVLVPNLKHLEGAGNTTIIPEEDVMLTEAWFYLGNFSYFYPFLDAGFEFSPINIYKDHRPWLNEFSYFTEEEYKKR